MSIKNNQLNLKEKITSLISRGNSRQIIVVNSHQKIILSIPLTIAIILAIIVPPLVAIGIIAALFFECSIKFEKN